MTKCDLVSGPCACGAWHYPNDGTYFISALKGR